MSMPNMEKSQCSSGFDIHWSPRSNWRIPDLNVILASLGVLLNVDVDGKVSVHVTHLVLEALGDTDDQVVDNGADGTEGSDTLAGTVVHLDRDNILLRAAEGNGNVREVLNELAWRSKDVLVANPNYRRQSLLRIEVDCTLLCLRCTRRWGIGCIPRGPSTVTMRERM
jgi:hypothetical protein